jgi:hypothetical protein
MMGDGILWMMGDGMPQGTAGNQCRWQAAIQSL